MSINALAATPPVVPHLKALKSKARRARLDRAAHRCIRRIPGFLVVFAMLLPVLITTLLLDR
jgi:hypothetical protein